MQLFADDTEIALLYFAGHGYVEETGGYLARATLTPETMGWRWPRL